MCGIAGYVNRSAPVDERIVDRQLELLAHRGPDSWGVAARGRGAVGQTRLSIIDLVTGDPPITTPDGSIGVAFNGEIYNYRELRKELLERGHVLRTAGDTEVLAHLAEEQSPTALATALDGMFGFAVWDAGTERLVIGRDRLGKKPLYYWAGRDVFVFGSEIKAVLAHPAVQTDLDRDAIPAYLAFGYVPTPRTFFDGVRSVPPGHVLVLEPDFSVHLERYWAARAPGSDDVEPLAAGMKGAAAAVRSTLASAVRRRLIADVPLGAFLSGGIDSSAIVGLMAAESAEPVRTFTIGFDDTSGFDEREYAALVARRFGTDHTEFVVHPSAVDLVERLVWHHDQPFGDSSAVPTFLLSELTSAHVTVALCGDGGDELFAGYERFAAGVAAGRYAALPRLLRRGVERGAGLLPRTALGGKVGKGQRFLDAAGRGLPDAFRSWIEYVPETRVRELVPSGSRWALDDYDAEWEATAGASTLDRLLLLNLRTYLLDDLLPKVDRMSMAHGLEVRAPFLDPELVDLAFRIRPSLKQRGTSLKRVLKVAMADLLPAEILDRPKRGFGVPLDRWFREDLAALVASSLGARDASVRAHVDGDALDRLLAEHAAGRADHGHTLWTLLTLEMFLRARGW